MIGHPPQRSAWTHSMRWVSSGGGGPSPLLKFVGCGGISEPIPMRSSYCGINAYARIDDKVLPWVGMAASSDAGYSRYVAEGASAIRLPVVGESLAAKY